jgi:hypothetical protein
MTQEVFVALNLLANGTMFLTLCTLIFFIFGRAESVAHKFPFVTHWTIKIGLCVMAAGSLFAFLKELEDLHHSIAIWQQLLRNLGNAIILTWVCVFHWKYFMVEKKTPKKRVATKKTTKKTKSK